eukprot:6185316-Pleurochrysis_carterae.AAC.2
MTIILKIITRERGSASKKVIAPRSSRSTRCVRRFETKRRITRRIVSRRSSAKPSLLTTGLKKQRVRDRARPTTEKQQTYNFQTLTGLGDYFGKNRKFLVLAAIR